MDSNQIRLKVDKEDFKGNIFKAGSIIEMLTKQSKYSNDCEVAPVKAVDEQNLPYTTFNKSYTLSLIAGKDYEVLKEALPFEHYAFNYPGSFDEDENSDAVKLALADIYEDKDYSINRNGDVKKKAGIKIEAECEEDETDENESEEKDEKKEAKKKKTADVGQNHLTDSDSDISQDYSNTVDGQNDPGVTDNYKDNTSQNFNAEPPLLGKINKLQTVLKKATTEKGHLTSSNDDSSFDGNTSVDGSGTVEDIYSEDTKNDNAEPPILGELPNNAKKKKTASEGDSLKVKMPSDGDGGGSDLSDFEIDDNILEGSEDEFRPSEAGS